MSDTIARGAIEVDIDGTGIKAGVEEGKRSLADLANAAENAGRRGSKGIESFGAGGDNAARKIEQSTRSMIASIQRQIAAAEAGSRSGSKYFESIAGQRGISVDALRPYLDQLDQANAKTKTLGNTAGQTAQALRLLPAQFTDIAVGLSTGQSPFTVLLQQGGQLKDSFGGIGPAVKSVGAYALGLVNPFTVAAAAVGVLTLAYKQGSDEQTTFAKSLILTGNYTGVTTGQLAGMAKAIDAQVGTTHEAADALAQLVATGKIYGDQLQTLAHSALAWRQATGTAVKDTVAEYVQLAKDPVNASEKLNETYHYLTAAVYEQIKALHDQGREQEAAALALKTLSDAQEKMSKDVVDNLGYIERAWNAVGKTAKQAWDNMLSVGRQGDELKQLEARLSQLQAGASIGGMTPEIQRQIDDLNRQITSKKAQLTSDNVAAKAEGDKARANEIAIAAEKQIAQIREASMTNAEKRQKAINEYLQNIEKIRAANPSSALLDKAKIEKDLADIAAHFKDAVVPVKQITDDAATKMLQQLREQGAALQAQLGTNEKLTASQKEQFKFEQLIADLKEKKILTADQKSLLASNDLIEAQLKRNVALEEEIQKRAEIQKLAAFQANLDAKSQAEKEGYAEKLAAVGQGRDAQTKLLKELSIQREYYHDLAKLQEQFNKGEISPELYRQEQAALEKSLDARLKDWQDYYKGIKKAQADWRNGATAATADYLDEASNTAKQTYDLFSNAFAGMEDALVNFVKTGKLSFKDLADQIIADLIRMQVRQAMVWGLSQIGMMGMGASSPGAMAGGAELGSGIGASAGNYAGYAAKGGAWDSGVQRFAQGGAFSNSIVSQPTSFGMAGGRKGLMGEAGPEAIMPLTRTPDGALGVRVAGGGNQGATLHNVFHINLPGITNEKEARQAGAAVARAIGRTVGGSRRYM